MRLPTLLALLLAANTAPLLAQLPPLTVPKGHWRAEITGNLQTASERYRNGSKEDLAFDFERDNAGSNFFPALIPADSLLKAAVLFTGLIGMAGNVAYGFDAIHTSLGDTPLVDQSGAAILIKPLGLFFTI